MEMREKSRKKPILIVCFFLIPVKSLLKIQVTD